MSDSDSDDGISGSDADSVLSDVSYTNTIVFGASTSNGGPEVLQGDATREKLLDAIDALSAKRPSTRQSALKTCNKIMSLQYVNEIIEDRVETLAYKLLNIVKKSKGADAVLAARSLELLAINVGADNQSLHESCAKIMIPIVRTGRKAAVRAAVIRSIAMVCFIAAIEDSSTATLMELFRKIFEAESVKNEAVTDAALKAWGLLATTRSSTYLGTDAFHEYVPFPSILASLVRDRRCLPRLLLSICAHAESHPHFSVYWKTPHRTRLDALLVKMRRSSRNITT